MKTADRLLVDPLVPPFAPRSHPDAAAKWEAQRDALVMAVTSCPRLLADNVARYTQAKTGYVLEEFPSLAPPWPTFWIEYVSATGRQRRGVLVRDLDGDPGVEGAASAAEADARSNGYAGDIRWMVELSLMVEDERHRLIGPMGWTVLALDPGGRCVGNRWVMGLPKGKGELPKEAEAFGSAGWNDTEKAIAAQIATIMAPTAEEHVAETMKLVAGLAPDRKLVVLQSALASMEVHRARSAAEVARLNQLIGTVSDFDADQKVSYSDGRMIAGLLPALQSIAFLHCKNAVVDEVEPRPKLSARHRREHGRPLLRFQTVRLEVPRSRHASSDTRYGNGDSHALHIVPGHFSHYGDCCPGAHEPHGLLFGRLSGVYWMPQHMRGNPARGVVQTDYDLVVERGSSVA